MAGMEAAVHFGCGHRSQVTGAALAGATSDPNDNHFRYSIGGRKELDNTAGVAEVCFPVKDVKDWISFLRAVVFSRFGDE
jgi:hypothetical protein